MSDLLPCPFCGTIEHMEIKETGLYPTVGGYTDLSIVEVTHTCSIPKGGFKHYIACAGRDPDSAVKEWNTRQPSVSEIIRKFVAEHRIHGPSVVYQSDGVCANGLLLIEKLCSAVGYCPEDKTEDKSHAKLELTYP